MTREDADGVDGAPEGTIDLSHRRRAHLVGIGGAGMSGIARMLIQRGHEVSGSDRQESRTLDALRTMGAEIRVGHDADAVGDAEVVVRSTAIDDDNVELRAAADRGVPVLHRSEMLAALMRGRRTVLVSGTHGKTTTTSMLVVSLQGAGHDPSFAIGGALNEAGSNAHAGSGELFVAEADESDRSFLAYTSDVAVVTNVGSDHPDAFADLHDAVEAFHAFLRQRRAGAPAVICGDDPGAARLADAEPPVVTYGVDPTSDYRLVPADDDGSATLRTGGETIARVRVAMPGRHNLLNAAAALTTCHVLGADLERAADALASFTGPQRRFQRLGVAAGVEVVDDYAHNPTKLRAALAAARSVADGRLVVVVQPHLYSRTEALGAELGRASAGADLVVVTDVYGAREDPVPGVTGEIVADAAREAGADVIYEPGLGEIPGLLVDRLDVGDLVLITGAGDVNQIGPELLRRLGG